MTIAVAFVWLAGTAIVPCPSLAQERTATVTVRVLADGAPIGPGNTFSTS